jgi:hypothetical protein
LQKKAFKVNGRHDGSSKLGIEHAIRTLVGKKRMTDRIAAD